MSVEPELWHSNDKFHHIIHVPSPRLNSYCPIASLHGNWHLRSHFISITW